MNYVLSNDDIKVPNMVYGTAWKKEKSAILVYKALKEGFKGVDTAGQPKHYNEKLVGDGIKKAIDEGLVRRDELYIQTKFTPIDGQDRTNMPYDESDSLILQVEKSFENSKKNLQTDFIDSYVLHSPVFPGKSLIEVWQTMQGFYYNNQIGQLGISNCYDLDILSYLYKYSEIKPAIVQNRFYAQSGYDKELRSWCNDRGIIYQSFWSLTANPHILNSKVLSKISNKYEKTLEQIFYKFLNQIKIIPLNGTTSIEHMKLDLDLEDFSLENDEIKEIESLLK